MNKKLIIHLLILFTVSLILSGCGKNVKEATIVATDFLNAYFSTDYDRASTLCCDTIQNRINIAHDHYNALTENVQKELVSIAKNTAVEITDIDDSSKNAIVFSYKVEIPENEAITNHSITVSKIEEQWKVTRFQ